MTQTHIHLIITHLSIIGSFLGGFVLVHALWTKSNHTKIAAYNIFIISALATGIAYLTGDAAQDTVENIQGVARNMIDQHEDFAAIALVSLIILGVVSIFGLFLTLKKSSSVRIVAFVILFVSLISFGLITRTGYLGGKIRHTETNATQVPQQPAGETDDDD